MRKQVTKIGGEFLVFLMLVMAYQAQAFNSISDELIYNEDQTEITGVVTGAANGIPIPGVSVFEKGTDNGTVTDFDGNYSLTISGSDAILVFSYVGFKTTEVEVNGETNIDVTLEDEVSQLDELIVVGYTSQKERTITEP
ncbi:CarboxypepD_reg-like domain-containing protein [Salegentibacter salegens]|uniref:CarboxypepD_reg-like domain-containing protein n=1 Tax=Salegentibacter salegens TaxID=143223 RepID=A0A1M7H6B9_9FLAO|nr:carboxypeptidase-like regulatory domain-containing protein [Salegentibacter salegens]SHM24151.1 CarboxypepD_reg-like domain-containing protein [Salegentibacter salegens]